MSMLKLTRIALLFCLVLKVVGCAHSSASTHSSVESGLQKGDDIIPFNPIHAAGPNAHTNACPICTYGPRPGVMIFTHDDANLPPLLERLQMLVDQRHKTELKGFVIVMNSTPDRLEQLGIALKVSKVGLCYPDPYTGDRDLKAYSINPDAQNTVVIYKNYKVIANFVNLSPANFDRVASALTDAQ